MRRSNNDEEIPLSRTKKKEAALAVTALAHRLADLPEAAFRRLHLDEDLQESFLTVRGLKPSGARDRLLRHIGAVLREERSTLERLQSFLDEFDGQHGEEARRFHRYEELRNALLDPDREAETLAHLHSELPGLDAAALPPLIRRCRLGGDKAAHRQLFRLLRDAGEKGR